MSKSAKAHGTRGLVPRLRFPEYADRGDWSVDLVHDLASTVSPPKKLLSATYRQTGKFPIVDQSADYICGWTDDAAALVHAEFPVVVFGDHTCELKLLYQPFAQGADGIKILAAKRNRIGAAFLYQYLLSNPVRMVAYRRHYAILKDKQVPFPDAKSGEQQKIADCLSSLDDVIAAHADKLVALKQHKQGLLEQLFPREGETVPRLRFPEFRGAGSWRATALGKVCDPHQWPTISSSALTGTGYPVYGANGLIGYYPEFNHAAETVAVTCRGSTCGEVTLVPAQSYVTGNSMCLDQIDSSQALDRFVFQFLKHRGLNDIISGSAQPQIVGNAIKRLSITLPQTREQEVIVGVLSSLDDLITAESDKLAALKQHKQGLLQQLFPAMDEATA